MATRTLITIDTELSAGLYQRDVSLADNIASSIYGRTRRGSYGANWMMDRFDKHGLTGVFFLDPMPSLVYGTAWLADIVGGIVARGHEVQLHIHTEWLQWAKDPPVSSGAKRNIGDYGYDDQVVLLGYARDLLTQAGAPEPIAFRAGNFGANDDTLRALTVIGMTFDSSYNAAMPGDICKITLEPDDIVPVEHAGQVVVPVAVIGDIGDNVRPAQICALSDWEMRDMLNHAADSELPTQVIVTHSFEMLNRARARPNKLILRRFRKMCRAIAADKDLISSGFADLDPVAIRKHVGDATILPANPLRSIARMGEQIVSNLVYDQGARS